jgi:hypothetical protein
MENRQQDTYWRDLRVSITEKQERERERALNERGERNGKDPNQTSTEPLSV